MVYWKIPSPPLRVLANVIYGVKDGNRKKKRGKYRRTKTKSEK